MSTSYELTHLRALEAEAIHVMREVAAELEQPGAAVQRRQGLDRPAAPGREGVPPRPLPVPADARRHGPQLPRGDRVPRPPRRRARRAADRRLGAGVDRRAAASSRRPGPRASRNRLQTDDAARRDRASTASTPRSAARAATRSAPGPRSAIFSFRDDFGQWDPQAPAARAVEPLQRPHPPRRARARVPALATGPSSTSGSTSTEEELEVPSIYFAHEREVFRRDGMLYAVSRRHVELLDGEEPFADVRALPHRRRHELHRRRALARPTTLDEVVAEIAATRITERGETRADDRVSRGRDGGPQGAPGTSRCPRDDTDLLRLATAGLGRRRQVDADRPPAATTPRRSSRTSSSTSPRPPSAAAARARSTSRCSPTACAPSASRASRSTSPTATSRPRGARFILADTPGPRAVHAQHGHGRLDRRPRGRPRRRAQGRARADQAPRVHRVAARHPPHRRRRQQDGPRRLRRGALRRDRRATSARFAARARASTDVTLHPDLARCTATTSSTARERDGLVRRAAAARAPRDGRGRRRPQPRRRARSRCSG